MLRGRGPRRQSLGLSALALGNKGEVPRAVSDSASPEVCLLAERPEAAWPAIAVTGSRAPRLPAYRIGVLKAVRPGESLTAPPPNHTAVQLCSIGNGDAPTARGVRERLGGVGLLGGGWLALMPRLERGE